MKADRGAVAALARERRAARRDAVVATLRALLRHRLGLLVPLAAVMMLLSLAGAALGWLSPLALLPRGGVVVPFVYPLF